MATKALRAAIDPRVSTGGQPVENQRRDLEAAAARRGWAITANHADEGISGAAGRDRRPGLAAILKDATRGRFDVVMCRAVDRMGRSLAIGRPTGAPSVATAVRARLAKDRNTVAAAA